MTPDRALVAGIVLLALAIPQALAAWADSRTPALSLPLAAAGAGLAGWAITTRPGGYPLPDIPMAFVRVAGDLLN